MSCPHVAPTVFPIPRDLVSNRVFSNASVHLLSCSEKRDFVKPFLPSVKSFADFTCLDFPPKNIGSAGQHFPYIAAFWVKRCVHTYTAQRAKSILPFVRYVRMLRNIGKPVYIGSGNRFYSEEAPDPPTGGIRNLVAVFKIVLALVRNHAVAEAAAL